MKILEIKRIESKTPFILSKICNMPFLLLLHLEGCLCFVRPHCFTTSATTIRHMQSPIHHSIYHLKKIHNSLFCRSVLVQIHILTFISFSTEISFVLSFFSSTFPIRLDFVFSPAFSLILSKKKIS